MKNQNKIVSRPISAGISAKNSEKPKSHPAGQIKIVDDFNEWTKDELVKLAQASLNDHLAYGAASIYRREEGNVKASHDYGRFLTDEKGVFRFNRNYVIGSRSGHPKAIREAIDSLSALGIVASEEQIDKLYAAKGLTRNAS